MDLITLMGINLNQTITMDKSPKCKINKVKTLILRTKEAKHSQRVFANSDQGATKLVKGAHFLILEEVEVIWDLGQILEEEKICQEATHQVFQMELVTPFNKANALK